MRSLNKVVYTRYALPNRGDKRSEIPSELWQSLMHLTSPS